MATLLDAWQSAAAATLNFGTPTAGSNRIMVMCFGAEDGGDTSVTSVDVGGQAATRANDGTTSALFIANAGGGFTANADIWYLTDAQIQAASDFIITPTYSVVPDNDMIHAAVFAGVNQTGGSTTTPEVNGADTAAATPNPLTATITGKVDGDLVVGFSACGNATTVTWGSDFTEQTEVVDTSSASSASHHLSSGTGTITAAPTWAAQNRAALSVVRFATAAGVGSLTAATPDPIRPYGTATVTGSNLGTNYLVFIADGPDFASANKTQQGYLSAVTDTGFVIDCVQLGDLAQSDELYIFAVGDGGATNALQVTISFPDVHVAQGVYVTTTAASQTLVANLPFKPRLFLLFWNAVTGTTGQTGVTYGWGAIDDADRGGNVSGTQATGIARSGVNSLRDMDFSTTPQAASIVNIYSTPTSTPMTADGSVTADGLDLVNVANGVAGFRIHWVAIGGITCQAQVSGATVSSGSITDVTLRGVPDGVFCFTNCNTFGSTSAAGVVGYGVYDGSNQWFMGPHYDGSGSVGPNSKLFTSGMCGQYLSTSITWQMTGTAMTSTGMTWSGTNADQVIAAFVHLDGKDFQVGNFTKATGAAPVNQRVATTRRPRFLFLSTGGKTNQTATSDEGYVSWSIGSALATNNQRHLFMTDVNLATTNADRQSKESSLISISNNGTNLSVAALGTLASIDDISFTLTWNPNDTSADIIGFFSIELADAEVEMQNVVFDATHL